MYRYECVNGYYDGETDDEYDYDDVIGGIGEVQMIYEIEEE
jgi:hypothetical protein